MVKFPSSTAFIKVVLIRGRLLLKGGAYSGLIMKKCSAY